MRTNAHYVGDVIERRNLLRLVCAGEHTFEGGHRGERVGEK
jgi:hypothetical protein